MGAIESQVTVPPCVNHINSEFPVRKSKRLPKTHLHTNAWRPIDFEFNSPTVLFSFTLEACCDPEGSNGHASLPFYSEKDSFLFHDMT
jgi:hypothetical protein